MLFFALHPHVLYSRDTLMLAQVLAEGSFSRPELGRRDDIRETSVGWSSRVLMLVFPKEWFCLLDSYQSWIQERGCSRLVQLQLGLSPREFTISIQLAQFVHNVVVPSAWAAPCCGPYTWPMQSCHTAHCFRLGLTFPACLKLWGQLLAEYNKSHIVVLQYLRKQLETVILKSRWPSFS